MIRQIARLPRSWIHFFGQLQFKVPILRKPMRWVARRMAHREGIIQQGEGQGLRFDATGGYPGYLLGTSEPEEQALLARVLHPGDVFYDLGANIGFYSTLAARRVGPAGKVFAFEPYPVSAQACRENARRNGFDQVTVIEAAVSDATAPVKLAVGEGSAVHRISGDGAGVAITAVAIDGWRRETGAPPPNVVMIDVEGAEIEALRGMLETIAASRPVLLVEVHWLGAAFKDFVEKHLAPLGYELTTYAGAAVPESIVRYHARLTAASPARSSTP